MTPNAGKHQEEDKGNTASIEPGAAPEKRPTEASRQPLGARRLEPSVGLKAFWVY